MLEIYQFPCLIDNYGFLAHDRESGQTAVIDTPDSDAILAAAAAKGWTITDIWNTHWHPDHAGGNAAIVAQTGARVTGPPEVARIGAAPDHIAAADDVVALGGHRAKIMDVGGHTLGHIAYALPEAKVAFVGDALFALGCGRLFEGTAEQMWDSLQRIAALPDDTTLYCAHEYTESNLRFALSVDQENEALLARADEIKSLRAMGRPTVPMTLAQEKATNPFLRAPLLKEKIGLPHAADWEAFAALRRMKDDFR
jgi:hydroxyacylglutathione hydrolase